jgi:hypothetical protein
MRLTLQPTSVRNVPNSETTSILWDGAEQIGVVLDSTPGREKIAELWFLAEDGSPDQEWFENAEWTASQQDDLLASLSSIESHLQSMGYSIFNGAW